MKINTVKFLFAIALALILGFVCEISYDDSDEWTQIYNEIREATTTHVISHKPGVRCDTFRLRFSGVGACDIYSITITTEGAGDNVHYGYT